jgi:hypothetical protein
VDYFISSKKLMLYSLSSIIYYYFAILGNTVMAWAGAVALFVSGFIYIGIYFGCSSTIKK